jgi:iron uptake system component EfeO
VAAGVAALTLAGCGAPARGAGTPETVAVEAGDTACRATATSVPTGRLTFAVHNGGRRVTEVYFYAQGDRVLGEMENIGPALRRELTVDPPPGDYQIACKPGMVGTGVRAPPRVTGTVTAGQ